MLGESVKKRSDRAEFESDLTDIQSKEILDKILNLFEKMLVQEVEERKEIDEPNKLRQSDDDPNQFVQV